MSNQDSPTRPAPAEVCERLKQLHRSLGSTSQDGYKNERATLTAALLLIEQGEQERERVAVADGVEALAIVRGLRAQLAAATERVKRLEELLRSSQRFLASWETDGRKIYEQGGISYGLIYNTGVIRGHIDNELAARAQPTPESK